MKEVISNIIVRPRATFEKSDDLLSLIYLCELTFILQQFLMSKQIVSIDFKKDKGLFLKWNYVDLSKRNKFFRHIIVLLTSQVEVAARALQSYIRFIKLGDLYTTVYSTKANSVEVKEWREKTNRKRPFKSYFSEDYLVSLLFDDAFSILQKQIQQINQPTIVNFIVEREADIPSLKEKIKQQQIENKIKFICTIFSNHPVNNISVSSAINTLWINQPFIFQFYHHFINQMAVQYAHLTITCGNGILNSCNQNQWRNTAFNKIQRSYYGPSVRYLKDLIHFVSAKIHFDALYELQISLSYKQFGGKTYSAQKKIAIHFDHGELYNRTVAQPRKKRMYYSTQDVELEQSPYESETLMYFQRIGEDMRSNDY